MRTWTRIKTLAVLVTATLCVAVDAKAVCPLKTSVLTSSCGDVCFEGRPCFAYGADVSASSCENSDLTTCRQNKNTECSYECFKYSREDPVENNDVGYTAFTFLIPFGGFESKWEQKWNDSVKENVKEMLWKDDTDKYPSMTNELLQNIDTLSFPPSVISLTIAGGTSVQGVRGKVAEITLATSFLDGQTDLQSVTLANLQLAQIPPTSFPPQLVNITLTNCVLNQFPEDLLTMTELESLDLSNNVFSSIPPTVFNLIELAALDLRNNSFTNVKLTQSQFAFLLNLSTLSVDSLGATSCDPMLQKTLYGVQVCVEETAGNSTANSPATNQESRSLSSNSSLVGSLIGGIAGGIVVAVIVFFIFRRRRSKGPDKISVTNNNTGHGTVRASGSIWQDQELQLLKVNPDDIEDMRKIGIGAFCVVYLVKYRQHQLVASKRLKREQVDWNNTQRFIDEIKLVSRLDHPRIVSLIGVAWTIESDLQAFFEYMEGGDLRVYVESPSAPRRWTHGKVQIAMDIVEALVYVHSFTPPLVHRDLKSRNVLLDGQTRAKLSDFGVARFSSEQNTMTAGVGTGRWLAPEVIAGSNDYDQSSDMFAFGIVLSELDTHGLPYEDIRGNGGNRIADVALLQMIAAGDVVPTFSTSCPSPIFRLAMLCLAFNRRERPTAVEVAYALRNVMREESLFLHKEVVF
ncbi:hypothetical protein Poli38472_001647 [Pythium oligandrum]|uniref:Protein kinase domain-containing protein n=1 Tax=Pythium oligandrum TaxID=41045 RepID=A0A8K1CVQ9_PYTOL|nr:hypothetical protein Poli38472_001647 [Pythium oligandrum]|eukprot:TMW69491.1 hypothetical protein Poli38472_001647 [Pythium oligandrum]